MLTAYIRAAMGHADFEQLPDGTWFGHIAGLKGVWADSESREDCQSGLQSALEDWIVFRLVNGYEVPPIDGMNLNPSRVA